jgi:hypothetical protein
MVSVGKPWEHLAKFGKKVLTISPTCAGAGENEELDHSRCLIVIGHTRASYVRERVKSPQFLVNGQALYSNDDRERVDPLWDHPEPGVPGQVGPRPLKKVIEILPVTQKLCATARIAG